jgi:hypothetical protein
MPLLKVNQIASYSGNTLTIGTTGDTVTLATGASVSGFGFDGVVWTSNIVTSALTVSANVGYFVNTSSAAITVTLPASASNGDQLVFVDYSRKFGTNALTLNQNSLKFQGYTSPNPVYNTNGQTIQLVYADSTQGWIPISDDDVTNETPQPYSVDFLVIAGGGGGGNGRGGGGGAGGYRNSYSTETSGGGGSSEASLSFNSGTVYTITVGAGGAGGAGSDLKGTSGVDSSISGIGLTTITSIGGGGGGSCFCVGNEQGLSGGSGGGSGDNYSGTAAAGTANQGFAGGRNTTLDFYGAGGGGAGAVGVSAASGAGGAGLASSITGSSVSRGGGGGGQGGAGGTGGGGAGAFSGAATSGTANTGGGGGGSLYAGGGGTPGSGGKGVVILRIPTSFYSGIVTGAPTVTTDGSDKVIVFNDSGSITG